MTLGEVHYWNLVIDTAESILACLPASADFDLDYVQAELSWYESDTGQPACVEAGDVYHEMIRQRCAAISNYRG